MSVEQHEWLDYFRAVARRRGGKCISKSYTNVRTKLTWRCRLGHEWQTTPALIQQGTWCPRCVIEARATKQKRSAFERLQERVAERGGRCIGRYINNKTNISFRCADGHRWEAIPLAITAGQWCPFCSGRRTTLQDLQFLAAERGGRCLSKTYRTSLTRLRWQCAQGHRWAARPADIKAGGWCPWCARKQRHAYRSELGRLRFEAIVRERGGVVLGVYENARTHTRIRCARGHEWSPVPGNIGSGRWCPLCARAR